MSDSALSMYYFTIMLFMPAVGKMQVLQRQSATLPSLAYVQMSWVCSWVARAMAPREKQ